MFAAFLANLSAQWKLNIERKIILFWCFLFNWVYCFHYICPLMFFSLLVREEKIEKEVKKKINK